MTEQTLYAVLGINPSATREEVRSGFVASAKFHHPDAGGSKEQFQRVEGAYAVLSDPHLRVAYDRSIGLDRDKSGFSTSTQGDYSARPSGQPAADTQEATEPDIAVAPRVRPWSGARSWTVKRFFVGWSNLINRIANRFAANKILRKVVLIISWIVSAYLALVVFYQLVSLTRGVFLLVLACALVISAVQSHRNLEVTGPTSGPRPKGHGFAQQFFFWWKGEIADFGDRVGRSNTSRSAMRGFAWIFSAAIMFVPLMVFTALTAGLGFIALAVAIGVSLFRNRENVVQDTGKEEKQSTNEGSGSSGTSPSSERWSDADLANEASRLNFQYAHIRRAADRRKTDARRAATAKDQPSQPPPPQLGILETLLASTPKQFEIFVGQLLAANGLTGINVVGGKSDFGVDVTATDSHGRFVVAQCKRYAPSRKIRSQDIQTFIGMATVHHKADIMIFVTTSDYTADARLLGSRHNIQMLDGSTLVSMIEQL